eukprot:gnl/MRDRNA2_/MRDRNA2_55791_c0_seq1.p1 gnl/MRDRNA2_/MRDRNA2_55791_c0~~gnl/MRDRNA2_/MRDRNA2_55791_c0_seq1.p1  ORF type:complete len:565 (-),score=111.58 gnl/MRDRNA2_/MRDRNA2_55791_c0_seq1:273-1967(-)
MGLVKTAFKGFGATSALAVAIILGIMKGPSNQASLELLDMIDAWLDQKQDGYKHNMEGPYFQGKFAPTKTEHADGQGLEVEVVSGQIPSDLDGVFMRIGPNPWAEPTKRHHAFDGDGMLHTLRIKNGKAFYHNAWMKTPRLGFEQSRGKAYFSRIGELHGGLGLIKAIVMMKRKVELAGADKYQNGQANTAVGIVPDGRIWALHEGSIPFEIKLTERGGISSVGYETFGNTLDYTFSAHPKMDYKTGDTFFHGYGIDGGSDGKTFMKFGHLDKDGDLKTLFDIGAEGPSFSHDMMLSENYAILIDSAVRFTPEKMVKGGSVFNFNSTHRKTLAVIPRTATSSKDVRWFTPPQAVAFVHPFHAWEEDNGQTLVLWAPWGFESDVAVGRILEGCCDKWYVGEYRLNLKTGAVLGPKLVDPEGKHNGEFSRIRDDLVGSGPARYAYTALSRETDSGKPGTDFDFIGFTKWDMKEAKVAGELKVKEGFISGEPVFVPQAKASGDLSDDGFLAQFIYGDDQDSTDFVLFDARSFSEEPVAVLKVPVRVPIGFHGSWLDGSMLKKHLARK